MATGNGFECTPDIIQICKNDPTAIITTMLDYYGLPSDTPGKKSDIQNIYDKVSDIENRMKLDVGMNNFIPNIVIHEFETLLFSNPKCFAVCKISKKQLDRLCAIRESVDNPEKIDDGPDSAPSKRILSIFSGYSKVVDGVDIAKEIGLDQMRSQCGHFNQWIEKLIRLGDLQ